ncbi:azurin [Flavobacterium pectinovorum]|uniref:azurin n=1 Tax=Flavobacterium pectinovorum TaxID=29533 RepID=UPI001FAB8BF0|nr:azurin [Flavobacterium pectinovorum]MCI9845481.1 azurin [Flavobacterium pectinovorum]
MIIKSKKIKIKILLLMLSLGVLMASCGGKERKKVEEEKSSVYEEQDQTVESSSGITHILLQSNDDMRFDKNEITVKEGQLVKITLKHMGKMPKTAMGHNFVLLKKGVSLSDFANKAAQAVGPEYELPAEISASTIIYTKMIGGGESVTVEFQAPAKGTYDYLCSFPGHYAMMKGLFIVQ